MQLPVSCSMVKPSCAVILRLGIVTLYWVRVGEVVCGLRDVHVRKICPVRDVTHMRNVPGPLLLNHTASDEKLHEGLGTRLLVLCKMIV